MQYFPLHSQVINLPVIGETHWHLSIKWHLIYALFMPHLCAQVFQLFIKCPLSCQNMEIEYRYSWYLQQTHQWIGSRLGLSLTATGKCHPHDSVARRAAFNIAGTVITRGPLHTMMQWVLTVVYIISHLWFLLYLWCKYVSVCMFICTDFQTRLNDE